MSFIKWFILLLSFVLCGLHALANQTDCQGRLVTWRDARGRSDWGAPLSGSWSYRYKTLLDDLDHGAEIENKGRYQVYRLHLSVTPEEVSHQTFSEKSIEFWISTKYNQETVKKKCLSS